MKQNLVSIVIPTYNRAHYLPETLNSIMEQTYTNWECIIVDDCSGDNTKEIVAPYLKDSRFRYFLRPVEEAKGANSCRNYGFGRTSGEYIQWFDSDDIMLSNHLSCLVKAIETFRVDFAVGDSENFDDLTGEKKGKPYIFDRKNTQISAAAFAKQQMGWITNDFLGKRSSIGDLRFNTLIKTDGDEYNFFTRYLVNNERGVLLDEILTNRRIHDDALSSPSRYSKVQGLYKVSRIKFLTFFDLEGSNRNDLKRWFLKGYMLNSYNLAISGNKPLFLKRSFYFISRYFSRRKAIAFLISIFSAYFFKKGYSILKYSRT